MTHVDPRLLAFVRALAKADARRDRAIAAAKSEEACKKTEQPSMRGSQLISKMSGQLTIKSLFAESSPLETVSLSQQHTTTKRARVRRSSDETDYSVSWKMPEPANSKPSSSKR